MSSTTSEFDHSTMTELAGLLMATESFEDLMRRVAELAARVVPGATTCGITFAEDGHVVTVASADPLARLLDEQQYEIEEGPCLQALATGQVVSALDLRHETRWDGYPARALAYGIEGVYASPLLVADRVIGALNLYSADASAFDERSQQTIAQLTAMTAATITAALRHYDESTFTDHLRSALTSRSVIDQAMGIIMGIQRCRADVAFDILRTASQHRNVPVRDVAADLVAKTSTGTEDPQAG